MSERESTPPVSETEDRQRLYIGLGVLTGFGLLFIIALVVILFVDPFGWGLLKFGGGYVAAEAIPYDAAMYLHFDLLSLKDDDLDRIVKAFSVEFEDEGMTVTDAWSEWLDEFLMEELDMTYSEDIAPWIGSDIELGVYDLAVDTYGALENVGILFAIEVRDEDEADAFLNKVMEMLAEDRGETVQETVYEDRTIYYVDSSYSESFALCRSENHIMISETPEGVQSGIDAQMGKSLADHEGYREAIRKLPDDTMFTLYLNMKSYIKDLLPVVESVYGPGMTDALSGTYNEMTVMAASLSCVDVGVRFDSVVIFDPESLERAPDAYFNVDPRTASMAAEDTFLYLTSGITAESTQQSMEYLEALLGAEGEDLREALALFESEFGFHPVEDLLAHLSGEVAIMVMPDSHGLIADVTGAPIGFTILFETDNPQALIEVTSSLNAVVKTQGVGDFEMSETEYATFYNLVDQYHDDPLITYGISDDFLLIGSSQDALTNLLDGGSSLADDEDYQAVWNEFPNGMAPVIYLDFDGMIAQIREVMSPMEREGFDMEVGEFLRPIHSLAGMAGPLKDNVVHSIVILFIDAE